MNAPPEKQFLDAPGEESGEATKEAPGSESPESLPEPGRAREIGGRDGPEPTRYGDWEKAGRCIDF